ncbi:MAG: type II toxin-antitoxin system Phd/YefM family antitoxin [Caldilineaceae bacterium]
MQSFQFIQIDRTLQGEEVAIGRAGKPVARLVFIGTIQRHAQLGVGHWKDEIWVADDFDELPEDLIALFNGDADSENLDV